MLNNPIRFNDPTGHWIDEGGGFASNKKKNTGLKIVSGRRVGNSDGDGIFVPPSLIDSGGGGAIGNFLSCWNDPECINNVAIDAQNAATGFSITGAMIEAVVTVFGCTAGFKAGVGPGCVIGYGVGNRIHNHSTNYIETFLSWTSLIATIQHDLLVGNTGFDKSGAFVLGEASATSLFTGVLGHQNSSGIIDAFIDGYASKYNEGKAPGIYELIEKTGVNVYGEAWEFSIAHKTPYGNIIPSPPANGIFTPGAAIHQN